MVIIYTNTVIAAPREDSQINSPVVHRYDYKNISLLHPVRSEVNKSCRSGSSRNLKRADDACIRVSHRYLRPYSLSFGPPSG